MYDECLSIADVARSVFPDEETTGRITRLIAIRDDLRQPGLPDAKKLDCFRRIKELHADLVEHEYPRIAMRYQLGSLDELLQTYRTPLGILELELKLRGNTSRVKYRAKSARRFVH